MDHQISTSYHTFHVHLLTCIGVHIKYYDSISFVLECVQFPKVFVLSLFWLTSHTLRKSRPLKATMN